MRIAKVILIFMFLCISPSIFKETDTYISGINEYLLLKKYPNYFYRDKKSKELLKIMFLNPYITANKYHKLKNKWQE